MLLIRSTKFTNWRSTWCWLC